MIARLSLLALTFIAPQIPARPPAQAPLDAARALIAQAHFVEAKAALTQILTTDDHNPEAHELLAYTELRLDDPRHSLEQYTRAAALRTPTALDLQNVAKDYILLHDNATAEHWMTRAVQISPNDPEGWYGLGRILFVLQRFQAAVDAFEHSLALLPQNMKAANNLGLAYEGLNRTGDAIKAYRLALSLDANAPHPSEQPLLNLGIVLIHQGNLPEAESLLTRAAAIAPRDPRIHEQLGQLYLDTSQLPQARQQLEAAIALDPKKASLHFLLGRVLHQQGNDPQAKAEFAQAAALSGTHATPEAQSN